MRHTTLVCVFALAVTGAAALTRALPTSRAPGPPGKAVLTPHPDDLREESASEPSPARAPLAASRGNSAARMTGARHFDSAALTRVVRAYLARRPGKTGVMVSDLRTGFSFGANATTAFVTASVMKVDILAGLLLQRQRAGRGLTSRERALASDMIRHSDNGAAHALYATVGRGPGLRRANQWLGLTETEPFPTVWGASRTTPADQVRLLGVLTRPGGPLSTANRRYVLRLMGSVVADQRWGVTAAALPGEKVAIKNGWTPLTFQGDGWAVNSIGRVTGSGHDFLVAALSTGHPTMRSGIRTIEHVTDLVVSAMRRIRTPR